MPEENIGNFTFSLNRDIVKMIKQLDPGVNLSALVRKLLRKELNNLLGKQIDDITR